MGSRNNDSIAISNIKKDEVSKLIHKDITDLHSDEWQQIIASGYLELMKSLPDISPRIRFQIARWASEEAYQRPDIKLFHGNSGLVTKQDEE